MTEIPLHLRCYVHHTSDEGDDGDNSGIDENPRPNSSTVLVIDTETTSDEYQNLLFGSCAVFVNGIQAQFYLFYGDIVKESEIDLIKSCGQKNNCTVLSRKEFVENIFYPKVFRERAKCVGFNLPFDLSRLCIHFSKSRNLRYAFSFLLSENK